MLKIKEKLEFDEELKKKIEYICNTTPTIINSNIQNIDKTNITYIENYRIIINSNIQNIDKTNITYIENYRIIIKKNYFFSIQLL